MGGLAAAAWDAWRTKLGSLIAEHLKKIISWLLYAMKPTEHSRDPGYAFVRFQAGLVLNKSLA
jgi:hypothetical protein